MQTHGFFHLYKWLPLCVKWVYVSKNGGDALSYTISGILTAIYWP